MTTALQNFERLVAVLGPVATWPEVGGAAVYKAGAYMDLHVDVLEHDKAAGRYRIALAHYFEQNGDRVPDPDMELCVNYTDAPDYGAVYALSYQDQRVYHAVDPEGVDDVPLRRSLNSLLTMWLHNLKAQGHKRVVEVDA